MPILGTIASSRLTSAASFDSLQTVTVGAGGQSVIDFTNIPSGYKHLQIRAAMMCSAVQNMYMQVGSGGSLDTSSNYSWHQLYGEGHNGINLSNGNTSATFLYVGYNYNTSYPNVSIIDLYDYSNPNKFKAMGTIAGTDNNGSGYVQTWGGSWRSTNAINTIRLTPGSGNFAQYGKFALYGIKG